MLMTNAQTFEPDWDAARQRSHDEDWAVRILDRVREDFLRWDGRLTIPAPDERSEWTHHYYCDDGNPLRFDPDRPHEHLCPTCGRRYEGEPWDGAWRTKMHNLQASHAERAALLLRLSDDADLRSSARSALARIIGTYARTYAQYPIHGDKVGKGRVMPQNLDESIWVIALLRSVRWAEPYLPRATLAEAGGLAVYVAALLEPQLSMIHNIHCWIVAALAECAVRTGDMTLLERVRNGPHGVEAQISKGFRAEGLWYETSVFYHFYTLAALLSYREVTGSGALSPEAERMLARAIEAPAQLAYCDSLLPAYNDCWPRGFLDDYAGHAAVASAVLPEIPIDVSGYRDMGVRERPVDLWIGARWDDGAGSRPLTGPCSVAALVFGPAPAGRPSASERSTVSEGTGSHADAAVEQLADSGDVTSDRGHGSFLWPDAGIGVLRSDAVRVAMRCGPDAGMHDHHDKLGVDVEIPGTWRSLDPGSGGYTASFTKWTQSACAHSIGIIGDEPQPPVDGILEDFSADAMSARVQWPGRRIRRTLRLTEDGWVDEMELVADAPGPLMWLFHGDGEVIATSGEGAAGADLAGRAPGSEWFREVRPLRAGENGDVEVTWHVPGAPHATVRLPAGASAFSALGDGNPSGRPLGILGVRATAREMTVRAHFAVPGHRRESP